MFEKLNQMILWWKYICIWWYVFEIEKMQ